MDPTSRLRRNRNHEGLRRLACETSLSTNDLILPLFVVPGRNRREAIASMPGVERLSVDLLAEVIEPLDIPAVLLFGVPDRSDKDATGTAALQEDSLPCKAIAAIKTRRADLAVITDVCLCAYTDHGHCGLLDPNGRVNNDASLPPLATMALRHARAGADMVAPSAMMDGQVAAIRKILDEEGLTDTAVMSYAAKFASAFYGPFRDAADSAPACGDRQRYQLPPANRREALREALTDQQEGADWLMVKPALAYLDILHELRSKTLLPLAAYQVSGEYAMIKHAAALGHLDERAAMLEALTAIKRAGADAVITYAAREVAQWLKK